MIWFKNMHNAWVQALLAALLYGSLGQISYGHSVDRHAFAVSYLACCQLATRVLVGCFFGSFGFDKVNLFFSISVLFHVLVSIFS